MMMIIGVVMYSLVVVRWAVRQGNSYVIASFTVLGEAYLTKMLAEGENNADDDNDKDDDDDNRGGSCLLGGGIMGGESG